MTMKNCWAFIFLFVCNYLQAQVDSEGEKIRKFKRLHFGVTASADISGRILYNVDGSEMSQDFIDFFKSTEVPKFAYTAGGRVMIYLTQRFSLETGLQYANRGFGTTYTDLTGIFQDPSSPKGFRNTYSLQCLDIPAKLQYNIIKTNSATFYAVAGLAINFVVLSSQKSIVFNQDGSRETNFHTDFVEHDFVDLSPCAGF